MWGHLSVTSTDKLAHLHPTLALARECMVSIMAGVEGVVATVLPTTRLRHLELGEEVRVHVAIEDAANCLPATLL